METFFTSLADCEGNPVVFGGFSSQNASVATLWCFIEGYPEQTVRQTVESPVISDAMTLMLRHCDCTGIRSQKTPELRVIGLCEGNSPVTGEFPAQRTSNAESVSIWWRHHAYTYDSVKKWWTMQIFISYFIRTIQYAKSQRHTRTFLPEAGIPGKVK